MAVRSWNGGVGAYDLDLSAVPDDSFTEVAVGDTLLGEIGAAGEQHVFTFAAEASDVVVLDGVGACVNVDYTLYSPSGVELTGAPYVCNDTEEIELPASGRTRSSSPAGTAGPVPTRSTCSPGDAGSHGEVGDHRHCGVAPLSATTLPAGWVAAPQR